MCWSEMTDNIFSSTPMAANMVEVNTTFPVESPSKRVANSIQGHCTTFYKTWIRCRSPIFASQTSQIESKNRRNRSPLSNLVKQQDYFTHHHPSQKDFLDAIVAIEGSTMKERGSLEGKESPMSIPERQSSKPMSDTEETSFQSTTLFPENVSTSARTTTYATHRELVNSSDTLRLMPPAGTKESPTIDKALLQQDSEDQNQKTDLHPVLDDGVALIAAKGADQTMNTKRIFAASIASNGHEWDIMQGKEDERVEKQISALGLEGLHIDDKHVKGSEISRTPSQSTTGTFESSTNGSLDTAASSLQSNPSSDAAISDKESSLASTKVSNSPNLYITACSSCEDLNQGRRSSTALRRYHALMELVETEKGYAEDLSTLVNVFFQNLTLQAFFDESEARLNAVCRNANDLLDLHSYLSRKLGEIIEEYNLSAEAEGSDIDKAFRCEEAIICVAQRLTRSATHFDLYQLFCSRHSEALVLIREAEKRHGGDDFAAYERMCGNLLRGQGKNSGWKTPSSRRSSAGTSTPLALTGAPVATDDQIPSSGGTASGSNTPSGSFASLSRQSTGRLLFADYLIKPIQRLCLYPLVLNSLLKYTPEEEVRSRQALEEAIAAMRKIADDVDQASKQREKDLMAELIVSKVESQAGITHGFLKSLGNLFLSGTLDVLHHHDALSPLSAPLRFQRLGLLLWRGFLLIVRVRKNQQLECRHWFPLSDAVLTPLEETSLVGAESASSMNSIKPTKSFLPFAIRLSYHAHHFELSATTKREIQIWHTRLRMAIDESFLVSETIPCSLAVDLGSLYGSPTASLSSFLTNNVKSLPSSSTSAPSSSSSALSLIPDSLLKFPSPSNRVAVDRNMIFSDILLSQSGTLSATSNSGGGFGPINFNQKDSGEGLITQQLRLNATPSIGSAVGAAMGLARMAATQMPTAVKRARRQSMLNLTEINPACDVLLVDSPIDGNQSSAAPSPISGRNSMSSYRFSTNPNNDTSVESSSKWKNTIFRRNSKTFSAKSSPYGSVSPSPMTSTTDLSQTLNVQIPLSTSPVEESPGFNVAAKPAHIRSRSMTLRDVWQNSIGRRSRTHSNASDLIDMQRDYGLASPASNVTSLASSPVLEQRELLYPSSREEGVEEAGLEGSACRSSLLLESPSTLSSITQLRRVLGGSPASSSLLGNKLNSNQSLVVGTDDASGSSAVNHAARRAAKRSRTELIIPDVASYNRTERRKSEPDTALHLEGAKDNIDKIGFTLNAKHSLQRLRRRSSLIGTSSPANSVINFANLWGDHSRLNSVEENTAEGNEHSHSDNIAGLDKSHAKATRPKFGRRPSTSDK